MDSGYRAQVHGRHGQKLLELACAEPHPELRLVTHSPEDDQNGWDLLVEITPPEIKTLPPDMQKTLISAYVQIKTKSNKKPSVKISLVNALKHVETNNPVFIALYHGPTERHKERDLYVRHVWRDEMYAWLKRARTFQNLTGRELRKKKITIDFYERDLVTGHIADRLMEHIDAVGREEYEQEKSKARSTSGYQSSKKILKFEIENNFLELIAKNQVGASPAVLVKNLKVYDCRFDIESKHPIETIEECTLEIIDPGRSTWVSFSCQGRGTLEIDAVVKAANAFEPHAPVYCIRLDCTVLSLVFYRDGRAEILNNYSEHETYSLRHHRLMAKISSWSRSGDVKITLPDEKFPLSASILRRPLADEQAYWEQGIDFLCDSVGDNRLDQKEFTANSIGKAIESRSLSLQLVSAGSLRFTPGSLNNIAGIAAITGYAVLEVDGRCVGAIYSFPVATASDDGYYYLKKAVPLERINKAGKLIIIRDQLLERVRENARASGAHHLILESGDFESLIEKCNAGLPIEGESIRNEG